MFTFSCLAFAPNIPARTCIGVGTGGLSLGAPIEIEAIASIGEVNFSIKHFNKFNEKKKRKSSFFDTTEYKKGYLNRRSTETN